MGRELVPQHTAKDLGVILDTNLTYDQHIYQNCLLLFVLSQSNKLHIKHVFDKHILLTIANALVYGKHFAA